MPARSPLRFIILCGGRSGSTLIVDALRSHPDVLCFGELLEDAEEPSRTDKSIQLRRISEWEDPVWYVDQTVFQPDHGAFKAVGFKVKYYHLEGNRLPQFLRRSCDRIIHNRRRNVLAQSVSLPLAEAHEFSYHRDDHEATGRYVRPITVDIDNVIERGRENLRRGHELGRWFRAPQSRARVLDVFYHRFCHTDAEGRLVRDREVSRLLQFLDLPPHTLTAALMRQREQPHAQLITNYDAFRSAVLGRRPSWRRHMRELDADSELPQRSDS